MSSLLLIVLIPYHSYHGVKTLPPFYPTSHPPLWSISGAVRMRDDHMGDSDNNGDNCDDVTRITVISDTTAVSLCLSFSDKASRIPIVGT